MAEPLTHIHYSFEDIQRYLQGKMSAVEMHAIEKAALQDPFLADAIEGYTDANTNTTRKNLNEINAALIKDEQDSKVIFINRKTQLLRIAALIIIIAGAGMLSIYFFKDSNKQEHIAQVKKESANTSASKDTIDDKSNSLTAMQSAESTFLQNKNDRKITASAKKEKDQSHDNSANKNLQKSESSITSMKVSSAPVTKDEEENKNFSAALSPTQQTDSTQYFLKSKAKGINLSINEFTGKVIDENNEPVPFATIQLNNKQQAAATDATGNFDIKDNDSDLQITVSAVGYVSKTSSIKSQTDNNIILNKNNASLNEVVVTALGNTKNNKHDEQTATPVGGWQNFNNYVVNQLNKDSTGKENYIPNDHLVELEFLIDISGKPYNIQIKKPLDNERNSKAVNILKEGPKWTTTSKHKKAKVVIAF